jgi:hypothetical protein
MLKLNLLVNKTKHGDDHNAFQKNGFVMVIQIVLMVLMKTQHFIIVLHHNLAQMINSHVKMDDALTKDGLVIMIMIVAMDQMKENSVILSTKHAHHKNSLVKISNVFELNIVAMVKTIVVIILMRLAVRKTIIPAQQDNLHVTMVNALTLIWFVTRYLIVLTILMNHCIVMLMNAQK